MTGAIALTLAMATTAQAAAPIPALTPAPTSHAAAGGVVVHFGFDGKNYFNSPVLNAADPKANDAANWLPAGLVAAANKAEAAKKTAAPSVAHPMQGPWTCSTWANPTTLNGAYLSATSHEVCSGDYLYHYTKGQFLRSSWSGPRAYTSWSDSLYVYSPNDTNDQIWNIGCSGGGTYNYNLQVQTHLVDTNGDHGGTYEVGQYVRAACGT
ncbi:hypothetical protein [Kitasatospora sp. MMS16-BH015]|uniref:hypothetical protein n=1 Tax=Kitasatospora sp. MMS16-BH015 TaxID=2018025 RepID=UPI00131A4C83|nr:hypothetical protein [Kitasatospora sp. MMS16-BH015]